MPDTSVDLLIVTALPEELEAVREVLPPGKRIHSHHCELTYQVGSLNAAEGVSYVYGLTCLFEMGNTDAGVSTSHAIRDLEPSYIIMFGIAAGVKGRARLADVIVSTHIFYYEQAKLKPGQVEIRPHSYRADALISNKLRSFASSYSAAYDVRFGPFAVGEKIVADTQTVDELKKSEPKLLGIEMESYGVARAAAGALSRPRFVAVRGVCDFADEQKNDAHREGALKNAASFVHSFLETGVLPKEKAPPTSFDIARTLIAVHHLSLNQRASLTAASVLDYEGIEIQELLVDQTDLYKNGSLTNPQEAVQRQQNLIRRLNDFAGRYPQAAVAYFGLAHIPLVFDAGYRINRRVVRIFATNRQSGKWASLSKRGPAPTLRLKEVPKSEAEDIGAVIIRMSISYPVRGEQIQGIIEPPFASYHLGLAKPNPDVVTNEVQLNEYTRAFHRTLVDINARFPNVQRIHLFMSAPPTVAFRCGQQVSKTVDPEILVYNFSKKDQPNYGWAINVASGEVIDRRKIC